MDKTSVNFVTNIASKFVQYFILTAYVPWAFSVLKYSSGTYVVDARELLIYAFSFLGVGLALNASQKKFVSWVNGAKREPA